MLTVVRHFAFGPAAAATRPATGEVHVWAVRPGPDTPTPVLTPAEVARADRYRNPAAAEQFAATRSALRQILSSILGLDPLAVPIEVRPDGKPGLNTREGAIEFNVSHTAGLGLVAVGRMPLGVDVEQVRTLSDPAGLIRRYFTPAEQAEYEALPREWQPAAFWRGWTGKEAVLKGIGCGVRDLDRCVVRLDPRQPAAIVGPAATAAMWELMQWQPAGGYVAAVGIGQE